MRKRTNKMREAQSLDLSSLPHELIEIQSSILENIPLVVNKPNDNHKYNYVHSLLFDLIFHCFDETLSVNLFWQVLEPLLTEPDHVRVLEKMLLDLISMFDQIANAENTKKSNCKKILHQLVAYGLDKGILSERELKENIELTSSEQIGLINNANVHSNLLVKLKTKLYFKSVKYNLLREENEGYSKLLGELLDISYSKSIGGDNLEFFENHMESDCFTRLYYYINHIIVKTIGYYSLDPNRVLGLLIECYQEYDGVIFHKQFLLHLTVYFILTQFKRSNVINIFAMLLQTIDICVGTIYKIVNLLNEKFDSSTIRNFLAEMKLLHFHKENDNITLTAKVKVKSVDDDKSCNKNDDHHQTVSTFVYCDIMNDLLDYIPPSDSNILLMYEKQQTIVYDLNSKLSRINFFDETPSKNRVTLNDVYKKSALPHIKKFDLCLMFIENHDWLNFKKFMSIFPPNILNTSDDICQSIFKVINNWIDPLYKLLVQNISHGVVANNINDKNNNTAVDGNLFENGLPSTNNKVVNKVSVDFSPLKQPIFYELLNILSFNLRKNIRLMVKLLRIFIQMIQKENDTFSSIYSMIHMCICHAILPALSYGTPNPFLIDEVWGLIKLFPYQTRFRMYGYWKNVSYDKSPNMECVKTFTLKINKYIMKRITKDNIRICGRQIGKLCHNNPMLVFDDILLQLQKYNNFIQPLCESLKYLTDMEFDVLMCCLLEALVKTSNFSGTKNSPVDKETSISEEKHNLALFSGFVMRKYQVQLPIMLQYISNQLKDGNSLDLIILKELLSKVSGYDMIEDMNSSQLDAIAGSELLKDEYGVGVNYKSNKKSATRLKDALVTSSLAVPLYILIAQQKSMIIFGESTSQLHLKMLGNLYDQCHQTLIQYGRFLSTHLNIKDYGEIPSIQSLINDFNLTSETIFYFIRSGFFKIVKNNLTKHAELTFNDFERTYNNQINHYEAMCDESVISMHVQQFISRKLYCVFWLLDLYDICFPSHKYDEAISKTNQKLLSSNNDRKELSLPKKDKDKLKTQILLLTNDKNSHSVHYHHVVAWLEKNASNFFPKKGAISESNTYFYQLCIYPRCVFSISDALYTAYFIILLHQSKTLHFSTIHMLDKIFTNIFPVLISFTEVETGLFGRFLHTLLNIVMRWHSSIKIYEKECYNHPCFLVFSKNQLKIDQIDTNDATTSPSDDKKIDTNHSSWNCSMDFEQYRLIVFKWHSRMTKVFIGCIRSREFYQIRNTIILLTKIIDFYPKVTTFAELLEKNILMLCQREKDQRPDLYALALSYTGILRSKKSEFINESNFCKIELKKITKTNDNSKNVSIATSSTITTVTDSDILSSTSKRQPNNSNNIPDSELIDIQTKNVTTTTTTTSPQITSLHVSSVNNRIKSKSNIISSDSYTTSSKEKRRLDAVSSVGTSPPSISASYSTAVETKRSKLIHDNAEESPVSKKLSSSPSSSANHTTKPDNIIGEKRTRSNKSNSSVSSVHNSNPNYDDQSQSLSTKEFHSNGTSNNIKNKATINPNTENITPTSYSSVSRSDLVAARHSARLARRNQQQSSNIITNSANASSSVTTSINAIPNNSNSRRINHNERDSYKSRNSNEYSREQRR